MALINFRIVCSVYSLHTKICNIHENAASYSRVHENTASYSILHENAASYSIVVRISFGWATEQGYLSLTFRVSQVLIVCNSLSAGGNVTR